MEQVMRALEIFTSKRGTMVTTATNLYAVLDLPKHHYGTSVRKWLTDLYQFSDGIRHPVRMQDYAPRKVKDNPILDDYYLSVEFAKLITLTSKSKHKLKYARRLDELCAREDEASNLSKGEIADLIELVKAMSMRSSQESVEKRHLEVYEKRNGHSRSNWWKYRADLMGYSRESLERQMRQRGLRTDKFRSQRDMLTALDPMELIRTGIIDWYMAEGKPATFARSMGDLSKKLAFEMQLEVYDDRLGSNIFAPEIQPHVLNRLHSVAFDGQRA